MRNRRVDVSQWADDKMQSLSAAAQSADDMLQSPCIVREGRIMNRGRAFS
jgi:hypothetical protein